MGKKRHRFNYDVNRRNEWKRFKKRSKPTIKCPQIKKAWNDNASVSQNLKNIGIAGDPNLSVGYEKVQKSKGPKSSSTSTAVIQSLEEEISNLSSKTILPKCSQIDVNFCEYMISKHGHDYKKMAFDRRNHFQETAKEIKDKIRRYYVMKKAVEKAEESKLNDIVEDEKQDITDLGKTTDSGTVDELEFCEK